MKDDSPFTAEYEVNNTTDSKSSTLQQRFTQKDIEADETRRKIEADYQLSKPRRKLIRARVIPK